MLDTTIVNVALPHMAGELGASADQISWVLASYIVASSIVMPMTGYLTDRLGRRKYLLASIAGFVAASAACGIAGVCNLIRSIGGSIGISVVSVYMTRSAQASFAALRGTLAAIARKCSAISIRCT